MAKNDPTANRLLICRILFWLLIGLGLSGYVIAPSPYIPAFLWFAPIGVGVWGQIFLQKNPQRTRAWLNWLKVRSMRYRVDLVIAALTGCVVFVVYRLTMAPGLIDLERDTLGHINGLQAGIPIGSTGYPVYVWAVQFFRLLPHDTGAVAFHFNLFSAIFGALSSLLLFLLSSMLVQFVTSDQEYSLRYEGFWPWARRAVSILVTFFYCFSPIFWFYGTITEVYSFNIFIVLIAIVLLLFWIRTRELPSLLVSCFFLGVSMGSHITNALILPAFALVIILSTRGRQNRFNIWLKGLGLFLVGTLQYGWIPFANSENGQRGFNAITEYFTHWFQQGAFAQRAFGYPLAEAPGRLAIFVSYNVDQFTWLGLIFGLLGLVFLWRHSRLLFLLLFLSFTAQVIFLTQYYAEDWWTYLTLNHLIWALFILMGVWMLLGWVWTWARLLSRRVQRVLLALLIVGFLLGLALPIWRRWPMRDLSEATYLDDFLSLAFTMMPPGSQLFDRMSIYGYEEEGQISYYQMYRQQDFGIVSLDPWQTAPHQLENSVYAIVSFENLDSFLRGQKENPATPVPVLYGNYSPDRSHVFPLRLISYPLVLFAYTEDYLPYLISEPTPAAAQEYALQNLVWRGYTLHAPALSEQILAVDMFWTIPAPGQEMPAARVVFRVSDQAIGEYPVGQGLVQDYLRLNPTAEPLAFRDPVRMVLPTSLSPGEKPLAIRICVEDVCSPETISLGVISLP